MERKYKVGDKVRIVEERVDGMNISGRMDCYLGKVMTISSYSDFPTCYRMKEDDGIWHWTDDMIKGLVKTVPVREIVPGMVIHCPTEEKAEQLLKYLDKIGYTWSSGAGLTTRSNYDVYKNESCYMLSSFKLVEFSHLEYYANEWFTVEEFDDLFKVLEEETVQSEAQPVAAEDGPEMYPILPGTVIYCENSEEAAWFLKRIREDGYKQICCNISDVAENGIRWSGMCYSLPQDETLVTMMSLEEAVSIYKEDGIVKFSNLIKKQSDLTPVREIMPGKLFPANLKVNPLSAEEALDKYLEIKNKCLRTSCEECPLGRLRSCKLDLRKNEIPELLRCLSEYRKER